MSQALYRKWRPQIFDEIVGQEHVTQTLRNALAAGRVGHAYLFSGLRGTGKTTMARLLAKAVNCLAEELAERPCNRCAVCRAVAEGRFIDLIEIDAASHTGVDDVRELRDKIGFRPNEGRYKVYIIDEVHRFSGNAFDALLKTIEEPPDHAIFVLATTELHKVPATILSRCQRFDFRRIPLRQIVQHLEQLAGREGWQAEPGALALIARAATGSLRDAISLLDQLATAGASRVTLEQVQATLGTVDAELVVGLVEALTARDIPSGLDLIHKGVDRGADLRQLTRQIVDHLRGMLLIQLNGEALLDLGAEMLEQMRSQAGRMGAAALVEAIKRFNQAESELREGWQPQLPLELALIEAIFASDGQGGGSLAAAEKATPPGAPVKAAPAGEEQKSGPLEAVPPEREPAPSARLSVALVERQWPQVLMAMRARSSQIQALLNSAHPVAAEAGAIGVNVEHEFARSKLSETRNKRLVEEVLSQVLGQQVQVAFQLGKAPEQKAQRDALADDPVVQAMKKLGAEVRAID